MKLNSYDYNHEGNLQTNQEPERQILYQLKLCIYIIIVFILNFFILFFVVRESESNSNWRTLSETQGTAEFNLFNTFHFYISTWSPTQLC